MDVIKWLRQRLCTHKYRNTGTRDVDAISINV